MKKIIDFCKLYLSEIWFVLVYVILTVSAACGVLCFEGISSLSIVVLATIVLAVVGGFIWPVKNVPVISFKKVWYSGFILLAITLSVCEFIDSPDAEIAFAHVLWIISFVVFVSLLGDMIVFAFRRKNVDDKKQRNKQQKLINKSYGKAGDVLCKNADGELVRVSFSRRSVGIPIAIFPFENAEYLELEEYDGKRHTDEDVDKKRLLDVDFCRRIALERDWLNNLLKYLSSPILEGEYLADSHYMSGCGWIVEFETGKNTMRSDYYGGNERAKLRYMGWFYGKCKK